MADTPEGQGGNGQGFDMVGAVNGMLAQMGGRQVRQVPVEAGDDAIRLDEPDNPMDAAMALIGEQRACVGDISEVVGAINGVVRMIGATEALKAIQAGVAPEQVAAVIQTASQPPAMEQGSQDG